MTQVIPGPEGNPNNQGTTTQEQTSHPETPVRPFETHLDRVADKLSTPESPADLDQPAERIAPAKEPKERHTGRNLGIAGGITAGVAAIATTAVVLANGGGNNGETAPTIEPTQGGDTPTTQNLDTIPTQPGVTTDPETGKLTSMTISASPTAEVSTPAPQESDGAPTTQGGETTAPANPEGSEKKDEIGMHLITTNNPAEILSQWCSGLTLAVNKAAPDNISAYVDLLYAKDAPESNRSIAAENMEKGPKGNANPAVGDHDYEETCVIDKGIEPEIVNDNAGNPIKITIPASLKGTVRTAGYDELKVLSDDSLKVTFVKEPATIAGETEATWKWESAVDYSS
jgi:hypothetical protein